MVVPVQKEYLDVFLRDYPDANIEYLSQAAAFAEHLARENQKQNLTRIIDPVEFSHINISDCLRLIEHLSGESDYGNDDYIVDLGSGCGIPGLLCAIMEPKHKWILIESEAGKADFLESAAQMFHVEHIKVIHDRIENACKSNLDNYGVRHLVARALGTVDKIYGWTKQCSTWNTLLLLKSRGWDDEWTQATKVRDKTLTISKVIDYSTEERTKKLVSLTRLK